MPDLVEGIGGALLEFEVYYPRVDVASNKDNKNLDIPSKNIKQRFGEECYPQWSEHS